MLISRSYVDSGLRGGRWFAGEGVNTKFSHLSTVKIVGRGVRGYKRQATPLADYSGAGGSGRVGVRRVRGDGRGGMRPYPEETGV